MGNTNLKSAVAAAHNKVKQANFKFTANPNSKPGEASFKFVGGKAPIPLSKVSNIVPVGTSIPQSKLQLYGDKAGNKWFEDSKGNKYTAKTGTPLLQAKQTANKPIPISA